MAIAQIAVIRCTCRLLGGALLFHVVYPFLDSRSAFCWCIRSFCVGTVQGPTAPVPAVSRCALAYRSPLGWRAQRFQGSERRLAASRRIRRSLQIGARRSRWTRWAFMKGRAPPMTIWSPARGRTGRIPASQIDAHARPSSTTTGGGDDRPCCEHLLAA